MLGKERALGVGGKYSRAMDDSKTTTRQHPGRGSGGFRYIGGAF